MFSSIIFIGFLIVFWNSMDNVAFQGGVFIHEIHAGGAAEKAGALHHGDLVTKVMVVMRKREGVVVDAGFVQVNETDFKSITHKDALAALRASEKVI